MASTRPPSRDDRSRRVSDISADAKARARLHEDMGRNAAAAAGQLFRQQLPMMARSSPAPDRRAQDVDHFLQAVVGDDLYLDVDAAFRPRSGGNAGGRSASLSTPSLHAPPDAGRTAFTPISTQSGVNRAAIKRATVPSAFENVAGDDLLGTSVGARGRASYPAILAQDDADSLALSDTLSVTQTPRGPKEDLPPVRPKSRASAVSLDSTVASFDVTGLCTPATCGRSGYGQREEGGVLLRAASAQPRRSIVTQLGTEHAVMSVGYRGVSHLKAR